jgi:hypothetical protein
MTIVKHTRETRLLLPHVQQVHMAFRFLFTSRGIAGGQDMCECERGVGGQCSTVARNQLSSPPDKTWTSAHTLQLDNLDFCHVRTVIGRVHSSGSSVDPACFGRDVSAMIPSFGSDSENTFQRSPPGLKASGGNPGDDLSIERELCDITADHRASSIKNSSNTTRRATRDSTKVATCNPTLNRRPSSHQT